MHAFIYFHFKHLSYLYDILCDGESSETLHTEATEV